MLGIIGGTGLNKLTELAGAQPHELDTPYGAPAAPVMVGSVGGQALAFLPRHGIGHRLPPHAINYRANIHALHQLGVDRIIGVAAVGGISAHMAPGDLVLPHDLIDYTWGRAHSYSLDGDAPLQHVEFSPPYSSALRDTLLDSARRQDVNLRQQAVHGVTQGPRLETTAEIRRLQRDGCDIVGMTGMPEAALAAELGIPYACLAVVVNWAAGVGQGAIHAEIEKYVEIGMGKARRVIEGLGEQA